MDPKRTQTSREARRGLEGGEDPEDAQEPSLDPHVWLDTYTWTEHDDDLPEEQPSELTCLNQTIKQPGHRGTNSEGELIGTLVKVRGGIGWSLYVSIPKNLLVYLGNSTNLEQAKRAVQGQYEDRRVKRMSQALTDAVMPPFGRLKWLDRA